MAFKTDYRKALANYGFAICKAVWGEDFVRWFNTEFTGFRKENDYGMVGRYA